MADWTVCGYIALTPADADMVRAQGTYVFTGNIRTFIRHVNEVSPRSAIVAASDEMCRSLPDLSPESRIVVHAVFEGKIDNMIP